MIGIAHIDGACDVHVSTAGGYGVSLRIGDATVEEYGYVPAPTTNNICEYTALLAALDLAHESGVTGLTIYSDSQLVVRQMTGCYKVRHPNMRQLHQQACELVKKFASIEFGWVPREENQRADQLSKWGLDAREKRVLVGVSSGPEHQ